MAKTRGLGFPFQPTYTERRADGTKVTKTSSTWWISYSVRGRRVRESSRSSNRADAVRLLKRRIHEAKPAAAARLRVSDLAELVRNDYVANGRKSLKRAEISVAHLIDFFGADRRADTIDSTTVSAYVAHRRNEKHRQGSGASNATINRELAALKHALNLAKLRPDFKLLGENNARKGFFEPHELGALLEELPAHLKPVAHAAYVTGWRAQELLSRQWLHVDFTAGWFRLEPGETKNGEGRQFPLTDELRGILEQQSESAAAIAQRTGVPVAHVFHFSDGRPIKAYQGAWRRACERAGLSGKVLHDMRRTAVRNLERGGVPRSAAKAMTGHRTESIYNRYAIVDESMLRDAGAKLQAHHAQENRAHPMTPGEIERLAARSTVQVESKG
jgi:integrase